VLPSSRPAVRWTLAQDAATATLKTAKLQVRVDRASGSVTFLDATGRTILAEKKSGEKQTVAIPLGRDAFAFYDPARGWVAEAGEFTISLGSSSRDLRLSGPFTLSSTTVER